MPSKVTASALQLVRMKGLVRARELAAIGIAGAKLQQLLRSDSLVRVSRGVYAAFDNAQKDGSPLFPLAVRYPHAVFCLLTALQIHGLTTQLPHQVWLAISTRARLPKADDAVQRFVRFADLRQGVENKTVDGEGQIRVTSAARTVADCFKFRNKIGLDIALEALRDAWQQKKVSMDDLWASAQVCRVANVMRPYMESLV